MHAPTKKEANLFQHRFIFSCVLGGLLLIYSCTNFTEKEVEMDVSLNVCYLGKKMYNYLLQTKYEALVNGKQVIESM